MEIKFLDKALLEPMLAMNDPLFGHYFSYVAISVNRQVYCESVTLSPHQIKGAFGDDNNAAKSAILIYLCEGVVNSVPIEHKHAVGELFWPSK